MFTAKSKSLKSGPFAIENNSISKHRGYEGSLRLVKNNKIIRNKMISFAHSIQEQQHIASLAKAVEEGNFNDPVFAHPDCQLYAFYLLKEKRLSVEDFLTINIYLMALMQYTDKQALRSGDEKLKMLDVAVELVDLNEVWDLFLEKLHRYHPDNQDDSLKAIPTQMKKLDNTVIKISFSPQLFGTGNKAFDHMYDFLAELNSLTPLIVIPPVTGEKACCYIPSAYLMRVLLEKLNPDRPVKPAPVVGNLGTYTLFQMHQLGLHPVSIYSPFIQSNPKKVHLYRCGPLLTLIHDLALHVYFGNLLRKNEYTFLFDYMIPKVADLLHFDITTLENVNSGFFKLVDLNFANKEEYLFFDCINRLLCIRHHSYYEALVINQDQQWELIRALYKDREMIKSKYQIDLEDIFNGPYFNPSVQTHSQKELTGKEILETLHKENNVSPTSSLPRK